MSDFSFKQDKDSLPLFFIVFCFLMHSVSCANVHVCLVCSFARYNKTSYSKDVDLKEVYDEVKV